LSASRSIPVSLLIAASGDAQRQVEILLTPRERLTLMLLIARRGEFVRDEEILAAAFGLFDGDAAPDALRADLAQLRGKLAAAIGRDVIETLGRCGHRILDADFTLGESGVAR
jgi:DNA-binding response OmpR family regulator